MDHALAGGMFIIFPTKTLEKSRECNLEFQRRDTRRSLRLFSVTIHGVPHRKSAKSEVEKIGILRKSANRYILTVIL